MTSHIASISPYLRRARERIALAEGVVLGADDDGRTVCDPVEPVWRNPIILRACAYHALPEYRIEAPDWANAQHAAGIALIVEEALGEATPAPKADSQLPSVWEALSIAIVGGILVIAILRGVLGHF